MSIQLLLKLSSQPSAHVSYPTRPTSHGSPQRKPLNRHGRVVRGVHHSSLMASDTQSPESCSPHQVDKKCRDSSRRSTHASYKRLPICNIHTSLRVSNEQKVTLRSASTTRSLLNLLRKRYRMKGRTDEKPSVKSVPIAYVSVAGLKQFQKPKRTPSFTGISKAEYEPLSRRKSRLRKIDEEEGSRKTSLSFWEMLK